MKRGGSVRGAKELLRQLQQLGDRKASNKVLRAGLNAGTTPIRNAVRDEANVETGAMKRSIDKKVSVKKLRGTGKVGANKKVVETGPDGRVRKPSRYIHLVNNGYTSFSGTVVPGSHFMEKGYDKAAPAAERAFADKGGAAFDRIVDQTTKKTK